MDINKVEQAYEMIESINSLKEDLDRLKSSKMRQIEVINGMSSTPTRIAYFGHNDKDVIEFLEKKEKIIEDKIEDLKKQIEAL